MGREGRGEVLVPPSSGSWGGRASYQLWWGGGWRGATIWVTRARRQRPLRWSLKHTMRCVSTNRSRLPRWDEMLRVVAPYVAEMLHLKSLSINRVAGVAGFQTMSTCKPHLNSLAINVLVSFFNGFLCLSSGHTLNFGAVPHLSRLKNRHQATGWRTQPAGADQCARHLQVAPLRRLLPDAPSPAGAGELPGRGSAGR